MVDVTKRIEMVEVNTFFQNRQEQMVTYNSRGRSTQVDYFLV